MSSDYQTRVFINCPFDDKYKPLFDAIVFAIHDLGFQARHALIKGGNSVRLTRIVNEIESCMFSIHDISRVELSEKSKLPRFNMPFEAGVAYLRHHQARADAPHSILLLDDKKYQHAASMSDVAGLDPQIHKRTAKSVIECVRSLLSGSATNPPGTTHIFGRWKLFKRRLAAAGRKKNLTLEELQSWKGVNDLQNLMVDWIKSNPA